MPSSITRKKKRISKLAACIRKTTNTARLKRDLMPDSKLFDPKTLTPNMSGKFSALITKIKELDISDMTLTGTKFKHFIFTDIRESAYGAKALASFMIAAGFDFRMGKVSKTIKRGGKLVQTKYGTTQLIHKKAEAGGCDGFALLQSLPLYQTPLTVGVKKDILHTYNLRPDNVNGELLRIVILDSKFKEGIDLKDVKYVHLLEPPIASSDLKQAVGRATRFCGQSGLHFIPRRGWPLYVFTYRSMLPGRPPFTSNSIQKVDAHALMLKHSGLDLAMINLTKELTVLAINSAVDYDLNYKINNFDVTASLLDDDEVYVVETQSGGGKSKEPVVGLYTLKDLTPQFLARCFKRSSKLYPFTKGVMRATALAQGYKVPYNAPRYVYCKLLQSEPDYLERIQKSPVYPVKRPRIAAARAAATPSPAATLSPTAKSYFSERYTHKTSAKSTKDPEKIRTTLNLLSKLPFSEFQSGVSALYEAYKWSSPIVKNGCGTMLSSAPGTPVTFTKSQDFVRHYLTPSSPFKGLLAWHSVGTGKTCMAVATASSEFEAAGYTILWVTRNALMSDVYKNIFGAVCSIPIMEAVKAGEKIPDDITAAKRMLSRAWLPPITYRMLQNALQKKNELGRMLYSKHPRDPLHKTFLIMDEVHKLMDGDLSAAESADFATIQSYIYKSYENSGADSVRPLLMTATPITDTPKELFMILNTLIGEKSRRLIDFDKFRATYTNTNGVINDDGHTYFQDRVKGLISYLNREYDPTSFAQPIFKDIYVPVGGVIIPTVDDLVGRCIGDVRIEPPVYEDCDTIKTAPRGATGATKKRKAQCIKRNKTLKKAYESNVKKILKDAGKCWAKQEKMAKHMSGPSQLSEVEACFGKKLVREKFPSKKQFLASMADALSNPDDASSIVSDTGAVFLNNST